MLRTLRIDPFIVSLLGAVGLASVFPCTGAFRTAFADLTVFAIALMFFLQGARLSRASLVAGLSHWRLHLVILVATFVLFPLLGETMRTLMPGALPRSLWLGLLFVCALPSTVQSSIAFTSIAHGNVGAAIVAATASNIAGIVVTPVLVAALLSLHGGISVDQLRDIALQLLAPFVAGQIAQRSLGPFVRAHPRWTMLSDRSSILLVVYTAFSDAVTGGLLGALSLGDFARVFGLDAALLAAALLITAAASRIFRFERADRIAILFCGSKKSLATGVPMAKLLFAPSVAGAVVVPLMIFHQMQLMACAVIARRLATGAEPVRPTADG